jgi:deoxyxylulose-5-phosphate synthase
VILRYPRGKEPTAKGITGGNRYMNFDTPYAMIRKGKVTKGGKNNGGNEQLAIGYGRQFFEILSAKAKTGSFDVLKLNRIFPVTLPESIYRYKRIVIFEESMKNGGIGEHIAAKLAEQGFSGVVQTVAVSGFVAQATVESQLARFGLDSAGVTRIMNGDKTDAT